MVDAYGTASSFGLHPSGIIDFDPFTKSDQSSNGEAPTADDGDFLSMVNQWSTLTIAMNQVTRSMGEPDFYPFVLSRPAVRKLHFVHRVIWTLRAEEPSA